MVSIVFIIYRNEKEITSKNIWAYIKKAIKRIFHKKRIEESLRRVGFIDIEAYILELPYQLRELQRFKGRKLGKINQVTAKLLQQHQISYYIPHKDLMEVCTIEGCQRYEGNNHSLYKALLAHILECIYEGSRERMSRLDITIVAGESSEELASVIRCVSPVVKFITVVAEEKESVTKEMDQVFIDEGISIRVTGDFMNGLSGADLVINLQSGIEEILDRRIRPKTVILDYGQLDGSQMVNTGVLVQGIRCSLPKAMVSEIDKDICRCFDGTEITDVVLSHKFHWKDHISSSQEMKALADEFKKKGYTIEDFVGRRNNLKIQEIRTIIAEN